MARIAEIEHRETRVIAVAEPWSGPSMAPLLAAGVSGLFVLAVSAGLLTLLT